MVVVLVLVLMMMELVLDLDLYCDKQTGDTAICFPRRILFVPGSRLDVRRRVSGQLVVCLLGPIFFFFVFTSFCMCADRNDLVCICLFVVVANSFTCIA